MVIAAVVAVFICPRCGTLLLRVSFIRFFAVSGYSFFTKTHIVTLIRGYCNIESPYVLIRCTLAL